MVIAVIDRALPSSGIDGGGQHDLLVFHASEHAGKHVHQRGALGRVPFGLARILVQPRRDNLACAGDGAAQPAGVGHARPKGAVPRVGKPVQAVHAHKQQSRQHQDNHGVDDKPRRQSESNEHLPPFRFVGRCQTHASRTPYVWDTPARETHKGVILTKAKNWEKSPITLQARLHLPVSRRSTGALR
ncbi:hypothetical protein G6F68_015123 [Rhizopus microsporus]|nr:hypothetical protein G6F68_015123 [Rhizopus microsporus]